MSLKNNIAGENHKQWYDIKQLIDKGGSTFGCIDELMNNR
jgi:hypothetical protein